MLDESFAEHLGQNPSRSENRDFGTKLSELEEHIQDLAINEPKRRAVFLAKLMRCTRKS